MKKLLLLIIYVAVGCTAAFADKTTDIAAGKKTKAATEKTTGAAGKTTTEAGKTVGKDNGRTYDIARNLETFTAIYKYLDQMYVDTLDPNETVGAGIKAMLRSLDPYTEYYPADEVKDLKQMLTGKYAGIGALIKYDFRSQRVVIDEPYEGMPAAEAGLKKGDVVLAIDDSTMVGKTTSEVSSKLRGEPGTTFLLKVERSVPGQKKPQVLKLKVTRRSIQLPSVNYYGMLEPGVGYLLLTQFTEDCSKDVRRAIVDMRQQGMKALVFDLRNNGGGSLAEAIKIVNMFVPKGVTLVTTKGRMKRANNEYKTEQEPIDTVMPVAVLVNENTASASEITAGSLQDLDRATIIGTRTFGKGLVQQPVELPHDGSLKVTISKYYIPSGRCIQAINYKHSGGGYKEHIPDSLTHEFKTKSGRIVRDGGGIKPDLEVKPDSVPNIVYYLGHGALDSTEVVHYYVVDYIHRHDSIAPAREFHLTDADYAEFKKQVLESGFKYDRETSKIYDKLVDAAKFEGYYDDSKAEFEALKTKLQHNLSRELDKNRAEIQRMLEGDIISAYYYQRGTIAHSIDSDNQVKKAVETLKHQLAPQATK